PIEAYELGEVYFVDDGNHRVSVAKQLGAKEIQAYVTEVHSRVPLSPDIRPEELILKFEYADFLENTNLDQTRPGADLSVTVPGQYEILQEHIAVHRYYMGMEQQHDIPPFEAAVDWYDKVYLPVVIIIRDHGLMFDFPKRTEADLYLWLSEHKAALEENLKSDVGVASAADDLVHQFSRRTSRVISRLGNKISKAFIPGVLEPISRPIQSQTLASLAKGEQHLFRKILVPVNGYQDGWFALGQALIIAKCESTSLLGLFIQGETVDSDTPSAQAVQDEFSTRCQAESVQFDFHVKSGDITQNICEAARMSDLVVVNLTYPPDPSALARLSSGIRNLIRKCPRPILFTPQVSIPLEHALLAYDDSLQAQEALYIATYLACQWRVTMHVLSIGDETNLDDIQAHARRYLQDHDIKARYNSSTKSQSVEAIQRNVDNFDIDLLLLGGYSRNPVIELIQGSEVDDLLRQSRIPLLVCR
ncbi:MAG TPA: universal stress protein, partial [Anaerolineales bacterium]